MKALTRQLQSMLNRQPYEKPKHFSSEGVLELNNGCSVTYVATENLLRLRVNAINYDVPLPPGLNNLNLSLSTGVLINYETLVVNLVCIGAVDNNCVITYDTTNGSARAEWFTGHNAVVLIDDKYLSNEKLDVAIVYLDGGYSNESPIISCIPSTRSFLNNPVNYNLLDMTDIRYGFYAIIETGGQRFFVRASGNAVPEEPVIGNVYDDNNNVIMANADLTAAIALDAFLHRRRISTAGFNENFYTLLPGHPYARLLDRVWHRYDADFTETPREIMSLTKLDGLTVTSNIPDDYADDAVDLDLRLYPDPYSIKFSRATIDEVQRYGIVNNGSQRCINIIDYMNNANEIEAFSCAQVGLPTSPNHDDVSLINCVEAPSEYSFGLQSMHSLSDTSGTIQITDTVSGLTKKYQFKDIGDFLTSWTAIDFIQLDFPAYQSSAFSGDDQWTIMANIPSRFIGAYGALKIIIQMNAPDALFTDNGSNRLAFCLNVFRYSDT